VVSIAPISTEDHVRRIQKIQAMTVVWMTVEAVVSLFASWRAHSPAMLAFGGDSAVELASAALVLWRFHGHAHAEKRAARIAGGLLFALAAYVIGASVAVLRGYGEARPTFLGIGILIAAAIMMPWLAKEKRKLSRATGSASLRADAAQSGICACLSMIALVGLTINAVWNVRWADPVAALLLVPLIVHEGWEALRGKPCGR
jgi:divalent metal cation (Fe/Co/Zn/Cd) transporter